VSNIHPLQMWVSNKTDNKTPTKSPRVGVQQTPRPAWVSNKHPRAGCPTKPPRVSNKPPRRPGGAGRYTSHDPRPLSEEP